MPDVLSAAEGFPMHGVDLEDWNAIEPQYQRLLVEPLIAACMSDWLRRWDALDRRVWEARAALKRARSWDVADDAAQQAFQHFTEGLFASFQRMSQALTTKLLDLDFDPEPEQVELLRRMRNAAGLFREENLPVQSEISALASRYSRLLWTMTVGEGDEHIPIPELERRFDESSGPAREELWRVKQHCWLENRAEFDHLFLELLTRRRQLACQAGLPDYRAYRWRELGRLDYTPTDALAFDQTVETAIVPLATRLRAAFCQRHQQATIRPWDPEVELAWKPPLPFSVSAAFLDAMSRVFARLAPDLGALFDRMQDGFLDLGSRRGKAPGSEEWLFPAAGLPYIRLKSAGTGEEAMLLLHEMGHAYHDALSLAARGLLCNAGGPAEFAEFAAIAMTYLGTPYLSRERGGFYAPETMRRVIEASLEEVVVKWLPQIALVDAFQHWLYADAPEHVGPDDLDAAWRTLSARFMPWTDWTGLESERSVGWQQFGLLFEIPFYNLEYGLAHVAALHLWRQAQADEPSAWRAYREALALGNTRPLPALYQVAGVPCPFEPSALHDIVVFITESLGSWLV